MSLKSNFLNPNLQSPHKNTSILHEKPNRILHYRIWRRRRLKSNKSLISNNQFQNLFQNLTSQFTSININSLDLIAPAVGLSLSSAFGIYLSKFSSKSELTNDREWFFFANPTPFNRFVMSRCPSVSFLDDTDGDEGRHFVRVEVGKRGDGGLDLVYQRECVKTGDGGVISMDWPVNLGLREERGWDTPILVVPGTVEGSMDGSVREFVGECLRRGCFPVVMNPRGCGGSPLTTPRLFTAADSDDIWTAIQFINRERPWTTLMGVGWGYGANMLTKHLAEVGEKTPLIAATCIDNPFDLEESTRSHPYQITVDQKLTGGLIDILRSNKELFQGRTKGFDVEKALLATSVREFEKEISMVSYGFDVIEDFYKKSSTRGVVGNVKVPLLFIQSDGGTVPLFSIPRSSITENPYTSLLLCSSLPSSSRSTISWSQHLTIEWLTAVELALLKGRHPLLKDVDVTINPSKGLALAKGRASSKSGRENKLMELPSSDTLNGHSSFPVKEMVKQSDTYSEKPFEVKDEGSQQENDGGLHQPSSVDAEVVSEGVDPVESGRGQVLQTAEVVMNMLDVTMPDTLTKEQKNKVLTAVGQGENLMQALQDAVPEDVRGNLTTAVSGIMQSQRSNLKFDGLSSISQIPHVASGLKSKLEGLSSAEGGNEDGDMADDSNKNQPVADKPLEPEPQASEESSLTDQPQLTSNHENDTSSSDSPIEEAAQNSGINENEQGKPAQNSDNNENGSEKPAQKSDNNESRSEKSAQNSENKENESSKASQSSENNEICGTEDGGRAQSELKDHEEKHADSSMDQNKTSPTKPEDREKEGGDENQKLEDKSTQQSQPPGPNPAPFSVSQAFDALTGMDDSTQVAVNSVFNVIEDMITQLEVGREDEPEVKDEGKIEDHNIMKDDKVEKIEDNKNDNNPSHNPVDSKNDLGSHVNEEIKKGQPLVRRKISSENSLKLRLFDKPPLSIATNPYGDSVYKEYLRTYLLSNIKSTKSLDLDTTTALFLEYFPEEGQWELLDHAGPGTDSMSDVEDKIIEPSYVIFDSEKQEEPVGEYEVKNMSKNVEIELAVLAKNLIMDCLKVEVGRRLSETDMEEMESVLANDIDSIANAVSLVVGEEKGSLVGERIISAITSSFQDTSYLRKVLPVGVIVGSSLASLGKSFNIVAPNGNGQSEMVADQVSEIETDQMDTEKIDENFGLENLIRKDGKKAESNNLNNEIMAGAVTAALGASAFLVHQQGSYMGNEISETSSEPFKERENHPGTNKLEEDAYEKSQNNLVTSFAEKAMSVASPVVPTKQDGGVDQERIVAMLAEWGQRGGMLRLVGKIALLWGGIRGAMSLTDKLISFLRLRERPLFQRILGFVGMVLVLWTPVVVPLLPTLVQSWAMNNSSKFAELACVIGLYIAILILVTLWGKRIRGFENPIEEYGLDMTSVPKVQNFLKGLLGGITLVSLIHSVNALLGCVYISWPPTPPLNEVAWLKVYGKLFLLFVRGLVTATGISVVEELLFRSWLPHEIAVDYGYHRGIIISGLAFALFQRSAWAAPGLWLLSLGLAGARQKCHGSLSLPIGLRAGIMSSSFFLQMGGFLTYKLNFPLWLTGTHPFQPFSGIVGVSVGLALAIFLYPRQTPLLEKKITRAIRE